MRKVVLIAVSIMACVGLTFLLPVKSAGDKVHIPSKIDFGQPVGDGDPADGSMCVTVKYQSGDDAVQTVKTLGHMKIVDTDFRHSSEQQKEARMSQAATQIMRSYNEQVASTTKPASLVSEAIAGPPMCLGCGGDYYCFSWNCPASLLPPPYADCTEDGGSGCTVVHVCCGTDSSNPLCGHPGACGWY